MFQIQYRNTDDKVILQRNELRVPKIDELVMFMDNRNSVDNKNSVESVWKVTGVCNLIPKELTEVTSYVVIIINTKDYLKAFNINE